MKEILDKISSYNFFNYLLPGIVFSYLLRETTTINIIQNDIVIGVFLYYFVGLVVSRIGSVVIEPIFKKIKFVKFSEYKDFIAASKNDSKIDLFSEVNNTYRTITSIAFSLVFMKLTLYLFSILSLSIQIQKLTGIIALFVLFSSAYRKQTNYITKRIEADKKNNGT
jgi:hypothetical protein